MSQLENERSFRDARKRLKMVRPTLRMSEEGLIIYSFIRMLSRCETKIILLFYFSKRIKMIWPPQKWCFCLFGTPCSLKHGWERPMYWQRWGCSAPEQLIKCRSWSLSSQRLSSGPQAPLKACHYTAIIIKAPAPRGSRVCRLFPGQLVSVMSLHTHHRDDGERGSKRARERDWS